MSFCCFVIGKLLFNICKQSILWNCYLLNLILNQEKSKKGQYKIKDNFIAFWFQFIYPNKAFLEMGREDTVLKKIKFNFVDDNVSCIYIIFNKWVYRVL